MIIKLGASVICSVSLGVSFANRGIVPYHLREVPRETPDESKARRDRTGTSVVLINPTERCSVISILEDLLGADYQLANSFRQERLKPDPRRNISWIIYNFVHFGLVHDTFTKPDLSFEAAYQQEEALSCFAWVCCKAMWRVAAYFNPFYEKNGEEAQGQKALALSFTARKPLCNYAGEPITARQKYDNGELFGDPVPLRPDFDLRVVDGAVKLVEIW